MKDKIFSILQRVGRSFMLPIAILPVAGLLLGIGSSFTNSTTLETYGLMGLMGPGTAIHNVLNVMNQSGSVIFANLPLIFAIGVAIGMAKKEKEVAALAAAISFLVMHSAISAMITAYGGSEALMSGATASVLGITSLQMGAFGGIIVGLGVSALHNKYSGIQLPQAISFFGGTRFVPIISAIVYLIVGIVMFYIWQPVQTAIYSLGNLVMHSGYIGTFLFGFIKRMLIPFGLHHVFYLPFWQTAVGGTMEIGGTLVEGAQNIFFAQLADPTTTHFSSSATRFFTGEFIVMIFGLPGAAFAMYKCARPEKKKEVEGLLFSSALTSILTGITEPIEFSFLFVAPILFGVHAVITGLAYMIAHIMNITVGLTFSGGFIDLFLFGILQGNSNTGWLMILPIGIAYFIIYYLIFVTLITKLNLKTPGREADDEETKLYTRADYNAKKAGEGNDETISRQITAGLGGKSNIMDIDCCATRLRVTVADGAKVDESILKATKAAGVVKRGNGVQIIYGPHVNIIKGNLEDYLKTAPDAEPSLDSSQKKSSDDRVEMPVADVEEVEAVNEGIIKESIMIASPITGTADDITTAPDEAFAGKMMGDGFVVTPTDGTIKSPANGKISFVFPTKHAIGMVTEDGLEILIHIGIDTVKLEGNGFEAHVKNGDEVNKGDVLLTVDIDAIESKVPSMTSPVIFTALSDKQKVRLLHKGYVTAGDDLVAIDIYE